MDIRIKTTDYEAPSEVSSYIQDRIIDVITRSLANDNGDHARCEIEVGRIAGHSKRGNIWFAEINVVAMGKRMRATSEAPNVNQAIDEAKDEIVRQIRKYQQLHRRLLRRGGSIIKSALRFGRDG